MHEAVYDKFGDECKLLAHNESSGRNIRVVAAVHGVKSLEHATKLATGGLACVAKSDAGYFGRGIYLSTYADYVMNDPFGYCGVQPDTNDKWLLVCWVVTGNVHPCIKQTIGKAFAAGHDAQYARVDFNSVVQKVPADGRFDELVVEQEHHVLPRYLISLRNDAALGFARSFATPTLATPTSVQFRVASASGEPLLPGERWLFKLPPHIQRGAVRNVVLEHRKPIENALAMKSVVNDYDSEGAYTLVRARRAVAHGVEPAGTLVQWNKNADLAKKFAEVSLSKQKENTFLCALKIFN